MPMTVDEVTDLAAAAGRLLRGQERLIGFLGRAGILPQETVLTMIANTDQLDAAFAELRARAVTDRSTTTVGRRWSRPLLRFIRRDTPGGTHRMPDATPLGVLDLLGLTLDLAHLYRDLLGRIRRLGLASGDDAIRMTARLDQIEAAIVRLQRHSAALATHAPYGTEKSKHRRPAAGGDTCRGR